MQLFYFKEQIYFEGISLADVGKIELRDSDLLGGAALFSVSVETLRKRDAKRTFNGSRSSLTLFISRIDISIILLLHKLIESSLKMLRAPRTICQINGSYQLFLRINVFSP